MNKILTVVIPTYNMEKYLRKCLDSLIIKKQELFNMLEVLVVIDGAKDSSSAIAHEYQDKYPNVFRVIDKENGNYGSCINRGLKEATGKYIKILDADDSFETIEFEKYLKRLSTINVDMVLTPFYYVNEAGKKTLFVKYNLPDSDALTFNEVTPALLKQSIQMHATAYRTNMVRSINYVQTEGISYTDQEWVFTPLSAVNSIAYFNFPVYLYLMGREGQTMNADIIKRNISHNVKCAQKIIKDYITFPHYGGAKQTIIDYKAQKTLEWPYMSYLVHYTDLDIHELFAYDAYVKDLSPDLYALTNSFNLKNTSYKYIKHWHEHPDIPIPARYLFLSSFIEKYWKRIIRYIS